MIRFIKLAIFFIVAIIAMSIYQKKFSSLIASYKPFLDLFLFLGFGIISGLIAIWIFSVITKIVYLLNFRII